MFLCRSNLCGWLGRAMVLGIFQCRGILLLWYMIGHEPAVLAAGAGRMGWGAIIIIIIFCFCFFISSILSSLESYSLTP